MPCPSRHIFQLHNKVLARLIPFNKYGLHRLNPEAVVIEHAFPKAVQHRMLIPPVNRRRGYRPHIFIFILYINHLRCRTAHRIVGRARKPGKTGILTEGIARSVFRHNAAHPLLRKYIAPRTRRTSLYHIALRAKPGAYIFKNGRHVRCAKRGQHRLWLLEVRPKR